MTDLATLDAATVFAEDLPDHVEQIERYAAAGLSRPQAFALEAHAAKIITIGRRGVLEIGQELLAAREEARHGTWAPFLKRCGIEERTAQNYMRVAEQFGDKPEMISALPPTALYALAAPTADPEVVDAIVGEVEAGSRPTVAAVKERLKPPPPLPEVPADLAGLGWQVRRNPHSTDAYELINHRHGAATPPLAVPEVFERARQIEAKRAGQRPAAAAPRPAPPALTPLPSRPEAQDGGEEEIATAAAPAPTPPVLTPLASVAAGMSDQARKLLVAKRALLAAALDLVDAELARSSGPVVVIRQEAAEQAARLFVHGQALGGAAAMLAFSATIESEAA